MIGKKGWAMSVFAILCIGVVVFPRTTSSSVQTVQSSAQKVGYDPWLDHNEDGLINILDIAPVARAFGVEGDPTRTVSVMNSYYEWYGGETIEPGRNWGITNETAGYGQVCIRMSSNATVNAYVLFGIPVPENNTFLVTFRDQFEVTSSGWVESLYKTYDVKGSILQVIFFNPSATTAAHAFIALYATT